MEIMKYLFIVIGLCCSLQVNANTTQFIQTLNDFAWSLGIEEQQVITPLFQETSPREDSDKVEREVINILKKIQSFEQTHHQDYLTARTDSLRQWQTDRIDTSGFYRLDSEAFEEYLNMYSTPADSYQPLHGFFIVYWKVTNVESMTKLITPATAAILSGSYNLSFTQIGVLFQLEQFGGRRYKTVALGQDQWLIWAYSHSMAYQYKWDLKNGKISDLSAWISDKFPVKEAPSTPGK